MSVLHTTHHCEADPTSLVNITQHPHTPTTISHYTSITHQPNHRRLPNHPLPPTHPQHTHTPITHHTPTQPSHTT